MTNPWRMGLLLLGIAGSGTLYLAGCLAVPAPEARVNLYSSTVDRLAVSERHVTDVVTAVNFDFRGFDTLGEEYILVVSVLGALVLLREPEEKKGKSRQDAIKSRRMVGTSDAVRLWTLGMTGPTIVFGLYVVSHGQLTPGGGFQGGVVLATAPLLIYLAGDFEIFKRVVSHRLIELAEGIGAGGFALIGFFGWFAGREFMTNVLPLGQTGDMTSGGTILAISYVVGLEVAAGFTVLLYAFLQSTLNPHRSK